MPPRQRTKSPRKAPVISGNQLSGTPGSAEANEQTSDNAVLSSTFDTEDTNTGALDRQATSKATFVGEQLVYKDRWARIAEAAYRRAEQRGFAPGCDLEDWLAAEREIDALLGSEGERDTP